MDASIEDIPDTARAQDRLLSLSSPEMRRLRVQEQKPALNAMIVACTAASRRSGSDLEQLTAAADKVPVQRPTKQEDSAIGYDRPYGPCMLYDQ